MTTILLARHGETDWNREGRLQGHLDPPLNDRGRAQARELACDVAAEAIEAVYTSDLRRAAETAAIVAAAFGLPVTVDQRLREIDLGSWAGLTRADIEERFPGATAHDGETRDEHRERVLASVREIAGRHPQGRVLVVTHGGSIRSLERHVTGGSVRVLANCEILRLPLHQLD